MSKYSPTRRDILTGAMSSGLLLAWSRRLDAQTIKPTSIVKTTAGKVRGAQARGTARFLGIPYGSDTGKHRFQPASPPTAWTGVRDCFAIGQQAPQMQLNASGMAGPGANMTSDFVKQVMTIFREGMEVGNESENCLFLNVYTPEASSRHKRPVMVWLHGGGFAIGSGGDPQYDGSALARKGDVVVVTLNHRLNALGYLYLGELHNDFTDSGNVGQLDIVLALRWVRDNIAAFGGDAGNVTIFGQSGGGAKVSAVLAMPPAKGLFHKAIIQSGPGITMADKAKAAEHAERALAKLGLSKAEVHKLQTLDYRMVIEAASTTQATGGRGSLSPVIDGRSLPTHPFTPTAPEISRDIPLMIGSTKDESALFLSATPGFGAMTEEQVRQRAQMMLGDKAAAIDVYKALQPQDSPTHWLTAAMTGRQTWLDSIRIAERKIAQQAAPVFMYRLDWETPILNGAMKSPHGLDVPLVFDNVESRRAMLGPGAAPQQVADVMSQAWINFARSGNPSQPNLPWPSYDTAARKTMIFDIDSRVVADPDREAREFFTS